jgi:tetratricopeptide (TPR) repeat protein
MPSLPPVKNVASLFHLPKSGGPPALAKLKALVAGAKKPALLVQSPAGVLEAKDLAEALTAAGFVVRVDGPTGDITGLRWGEGALPSDEASLRRVLTTLAEEAREPSILIIETGGEEIKTLIARGKARRPFYGRTAVEEVVRAAQKAAEKKHLAAAIDGYRWLCAVEPDTDDPEDMLRTWWSESWGTLARLLAEDGRWDELLDLGAQNPITRDTLLSIAWEIEEQDPDAAECIVRAHLDRDPTSEQALRWLLRRANAACRYEEVLEFARRLKEVAPGEGDGEVWALLSLARYDEALPLARLAASSESASSWDRAVLGDLLSATGRQEEAKQAWTEALEAIDKDSDWGPSWAWRAELLLRVDRLGEARAALERALRGEGCDDYHVHLARGLIALASDDAEGAVLAMEDAVRSGPTYEHGRFHLACALARAGKLERAQAVAREAAALSRDVARRIAQEPALTPGEPRPRKRAKG